MSPAETLLAASGVGLGVYAGALLALLAAGRRTAARALGGFIPDCIVLVHRLRADGRITRRSRLLLAALIGYLALPFDLVPDFLPVVGQLDDAVIVALVLRAVLREAGPDRVREHWPGPPGSAAVVLRLIGSYQRRRAP